MKNAFSIPLSAVALTACLALSAQSEAGKIAKFSVGIRERIDAEIRGRNWVAYKVAGMSEKMLPEDAEIFEIGEVRLDLTKPMDDIIAVLNGYKGQGKLSNLDIKEVENGPKDTFENILDAAYIKFAEEETSQGKTAVLAACIEKLSPLRHVLGPQAYPEYDIIRRLYAVQLGNQATNADAQSLSIYSRSTALLARLYLEVQDRSAPAQHQEAVDEAQELKEALSKGLFNLAQAFIANLSQEGTEEPSLPGVFAYTAKLINAFDLSPLPKATLNGALAPQDDPTATPMGVRAALSIELLAALGGRLADTHPGTLDLFAPPQGMFQAYERAGPDGQTVAYMHAASDNGLASIVGMAVHQKLASAQLTPLPSPQDHEIVCSIQRHLGASRPTNFSALLRELFLPQAAIGFEEPAQRNTSTGSSGE